MQLAAGKAAAWRDGIACDVCEGRWLLVEAKHPLLPAAAAAGLPPASQA